MNHHLILQPMFTVLILTLVMTGWVYFTRIPAMKKLRIHPQKAQDTSKLKDLLPAEVTRVSNNYNNLFEQPTIFYVTCLSIAALNLTGHDYLICAWSYAVLRICHSLVQATIDRVMIRFSLFALTWLPLGYMIIKASAHVFLL
jgi:hypothetical protein